MDMKVELIPVPVADPDGNIIELLQQHDEASGRRRRQTQGG